VPLDLFIYLFICLFICLFAKHPCTDKSVWCSELGVGVKGSGFGVRVRGSGFGVAGLGPGQDINDGRWLMEQEVLLFQAQVCPFVC
jgi:hypothetical protein